MNTISRIYRYYKDPRPDLVPAFKLMLRPEFKMPVWEFAKYLMNLAINKIPGARSLTGRERKVSFAEYMLAYDRTTATFVPYRQLLDRVAELVAAGPGEKVLDLGSGTGNLSQAVAQRGGQVISIDNSPEANRIHRGKRARAEILEVNIDRPDSALGFIPLPDGHVKHVCAANLWTYIKNRATLYAEIRRILPPDGDFVLAIERKGYSPLEILKAHLKAEYNRHIKEGNMPLTACVKVYSGFIAHYDDLMTTMHETKKLMRGIAAGDYAVFSEAEIRREVEANGFIVLSIELAYADQCVIVRARPRR